MTLYLVMFAVTDKIYVLWFDAQRDYISFIFFVKRKSNTLARHFWPNNQKCDDD